MIIKANFKLGNSSYSIEADEKDPVESFHQAIVLSNPPQKCICNNEVGFHMTSNKDKEGNTYVNIKCDNCGARAKLGQYKTGGYFWRNFEKYVKPSSKTSEDQEKTAGGLDVSDFQD